MTYFDLDWSAKFPFGGPRNVRNLIGVAIHTSEGSDPNNPASATALANYQIRSRTGSYHVIVDQTGLRLRTNTDDWSTWSTGNKGNDVLLHLAFTAYSSWSRAKWLSEDKMLRAGASTVAHWLKTYGWPNEKDPNVAALPGIVGHSETTAWGGSDHTDPGPNFPWPEFIQMVGDAMRGAATPTPPKENIVDHNQEIWDQLRGPGGKGWAQLGGRSLVDAVAAIGEKLGVPGMKAPGK